MPLFKKKPIPIQADQWFKNGDHPEDGPAEFEGKVVRYWRRPTATRDDLCQHCRLKMNDHGWIDTLEGGHIVCPGDFIITGVRGERYPCKPDIFAETYEPA